MASHNTGASPPAVSAVAGLSAEEIVALRAWMSRASAVAVALGILGIANLGFVWNLHRSMAHTAEEAADKAAKDYFTNLSDSEQWDAIRTRAEQAGVLALERAIEAQSEAKSLQVNLERIQAELLDLQSTLGRFRTAVDTIRNTKRNDVILQIASLTNDQMDTLVDLNRLQKMQEQLDALENHAAIRWLKSAAIIDPRGTRLPALFVDELYVSQKVWSHEVFSPHYYALDVDTPFVKREFTLPALPGSP